MNIFNKVALQSMKKSRTRTIVTVIGVVLSTAMITAVITFGISLFNYMANGAAQKYGGWHIEFEDVNSSFVAKQASNDKVASTTTFENIGYAKLDGVKTSNKPYLFIAGFSKKAFDTLPLTLVSGRLPKTSGEILVSGSISTKGGVQFKVGDTLTLAVGNRMNGNKKLGQSDSYTAKSETFVPQGERTYTVVGIPIGVIVGIGSMGLVLSVVAKNFANILYSNVPLTLTVFAPAIVAAATVSMVTVLISAYIPLARPQAFP